MKTRLLSLALTLILAVGILPGCTSTQLQTVGADSQQVADAIRHAENAGFTPAEFDQYVQGYTALVPSTQKYIPEAELAFAGLYEGGNLTATALERVAARYDTKTVAAGAVTPVTPATVAGAFKQVAAIGN